MKRCAGRSNVQLCRLLIVVVVALCFMHFNGNALKKDIAAGPATAATATASKESSWNWNSVQVKKRRNTYHEVCDSPSATAESVEKVLEDWFVPSQSPDSTPPFRLQSPTLLACNYTFLDLGSNIGDSMGKFIDSGIGSCNNRNETPGYSITQGVVGRDAYVENALSRWAFIRMRKHAKRIGRGLYPEDYCYYGVEGNPLFTQRLIDLEELVMRSTPRPLSRAHFLTESVSTRLDGPATLYLDTVNTIENFGGSSIHARHEDIKTSAANATHQKPIAVFVTGIAPSTLVQQTVIKHAGNHVLIKMDIEGSEFDVLFAAFESGVLCRYVKAGVQVDMVVERHDNSQGADERTWKTIRDRWDQIVVPGLKECGVTILDGNGVDAML